MLENLRSKVNDICENFVLEQPRRPNKNKMNNAHVQSTGGFISGEVKLALTLRLLAGGTYMDLALLYKVGMAYAYKNFHDVVHNWTNDDRFVDINGEDYLNVDIKMAKVANDFAMDSKGYFKEQLEHSTDGL